MEKRSSEEYEKYYRDLLAEQRSSGLSVRAFAGQKGIPAGTLSSRWYELRCRDAERAGVPRTKPERRAGPEPSFVPVRLVEGTTRQSTVGGYEVELGGGRVVRLPPDFDGARAVALLRAVASC